MTMTETETTTTTKKKARTASEPVPITMLLPLADIDESATNPRQIFKEMDAFAKELRAHGVLEPVLVRPSPTAPGRFELVFGSRRYRAAKLAGLAELPAMVRTLSDEEVLEIQIAENSQREDIHPMEEAAGYQALHERHGWSPEDIAARVGKSVATVRQRMKLLSLIPAAQKAFLEDRFTAGVALLIARIPHADLQADALKELRNRHGDDAASAFTVRDFGWVVQSRYMLALVDAPFDGKDPALVAGVPDCGSCPKRTGHQRELFTEVSLKGVDHCIDPKCWATKKEAAWEKKVAEAKADKRKVMSAKEAKTVFQPYGDAPVSSPSFVDLDAKTYDARGKAVSNRSLLGGKAAEVPTVLARDPNGRARELVAAGDFKTAAKSNGHAFLAGGKFAGPKKKPAELAADKAQRTREANKRAAREAQITELVATAEADATTGGEFWCAVARGIATSAWSETRLEVCRRRKIDTKGRSQESEKLLSDLIDAMTPSQARGLVVELLVATGRGSHELALAEFVEVYGLGEKPKAKAKTKAKSKTRAR